MTTIITNTVEETKILVNFNLQDGSLTFPSVEINTEGDIDFNSLILKLSELIEQNRQLEVEYVDAELLVESNSKIGLVKTTLDEIYNEFNASIDLSSEQSTEESEEISN
ncbi:hypothetical protein HZQ57_15990 [Elizabethkingia anophelis]|nr:hypothetical protein [Elizabethkingia anophelis]MCT3813902.1 hypothetical protein [Elizabethkingia anophelis]MCT3820996.1 hypothetical protein [Elizabethkingia anophelis]